MNLKQVCSHCFRTWDIYDETTRDEDGYSRCPDCKDILTCIDMDSEQEIEKIQPQKAEQPEEPKVRVMKHDWNMILSKNFKLRPQDKTCNEKGRMCVSWIDDGKEIPLCEGFKFDDNGKFLGFDLKKCKKCKKAIKENA